MMMQHHERSAEMEACIRNCTDCHHICLELVPHCLNMGGEHAAPAHITLLLDCAQSCATGADFMIRNSQYHGQACGFCAQVCEACAADCERLAGDDAMMRDCAEACRRCAQSCREMAA